MSKAKKCLLYAWIIYIVGLLTLYISNFIHFYVCKNTGMTIREFSKVSISSAVSESSWIGTLSFTIIFFISFLFLLISFIHKIRNKKDDPLFLIIGFYIFNILMAICFNFLLFLLLYRGSL
jgi:hypothetical protein